MMLRFAAALAAIAAAVPPAAEARFVVTPDEEPVARTAARNEACLRRKKNVARRFVECLYEKGEDAEDCWEDAGGEDEKDRKKRDKKKKDDDEEEDELLDPNVDCGGEVGFDHVADLGDICLDAKIRKQDAKRMAVLLYSMGHVAALGDTNGNTGGGTCEDHKSCRSCVRNGCTWLLGECREECDVLDAGCYSRKDMEGTPAEICQVWRGRDRDARACSRPKNCNDCMGKPLPSDGSQSCVWFEAADGGGTESFCSSGFGFMPGDPATMCETGGGEAEGGGNGRLAACETYVETCMLVGTEGPDNCECLARSVTDPKVCDDVPEDECVCMGLGCLDEAGDPVDPCLGFAAARVDGSGECQVVEDECETYVKTCSVEGDGGGTCVCAARSIYGDKAECPEGAGPCACAMCRVDKENDGGLMSLCDGFSAQLVDGVCTLVED